MIVIGSDAALPVNGSNACWNSIAVTRSAPIAASSISLNVCGTINPCKCLPDPVKAARRARSMTELANLRRATRRDLAPDDLARLAHALACSGDPPPVYAAAEAVAAEVIGHRLFTIMWFDAATLEVERVHTNAPTVYPLGGRKKKARTA